MIRALLFVAALLLSLRAAHAEVLVYTGSASVVDYEARTKPFIRKCFVVSDPVAKKFFTIDYGTTGGVKRRNVQTYSGNYFPLSRLDGTKFDFYSSVTNESTPAILQQSAFFRGLQKTVVIRLQQDNPVTAQRAKDLTGKVIYFGAGFGYAYNEIVFTTAFSESRTVDVNVRGLTIDQYRAELEALLGAQGFGL